MPVLAPGRFSITTPWPQISDSFCPTIRMLTSVGPPAGKGTTIFTGRLGKPCASFCAVAEPAVAGRSRRATTVLTIDPHPDPPPFRERKTPRTVVLPLKGGGIWWGSYFVIASRAELAREVIEQIVDGDSLGDHLLLERVV